MTCTADTKMLSAPVAMPWRAAPDARTLVMRAPELGELSRVPEHTPVPGPLPVPPVHVPAARPRPEAFAMLRRIALQRDLASAVGVLHLELGALVGAKVVLAVVSDEQISCPL